MKRTGYIDQIKEQLSVHSVCAILGPRQVGKTTLAHMYIEHDSSLKPRFFDLENPQDLTLLENPLFVLTDSQYNFFVIDEIQRRPDLFPVLRYIIDQTEPRIKFLILGSASRDLIAQSSETLAGRIGYLELTPFSIEETHELKKLWLRGGFPRSYLAQNNRASYVWRENYISTFLERDIPLLGFDIPPTQIRRFWMMIAHYHGQIFNASEIGRSLGITNHTARKYLDILAGTFMVRILTPWFENISKRQVKSPKIYFRDSGLLHALLNIRDEIQLSTNPRLGSFWEGFALEEIIRAANVRTEDCYFWATQADAELDLLIMKNGKRYGFEIKFMQAPKITKSMRTAVQDLQLDHLLIIIPGTIFAQLDTNITMFGIDNLASGNSAALFP